VPFGQLPAVQQAPPAGDHFALSPIPGEGAPPQQLEEAVAVAKFALLPGSDALLLGAVQSATPSEWWMTKALLVVRSSTCDVGATFDR